MSLGEIIRQYRKEHSMTMEAFANAIGRTRGYISQLENNTRYWNGICIAKLWQVYLYIWHVIARK